MQNIKLRPVQCSMFSVVHLQLSELNRFCVFIFFFSFLYSLSTRTDFCVSFGFESTIGIAVFCVLYNIIYANEWSTIVSCHIYFIGSVVVTASPVQSLLYRFRSRFRLHSTRVRIFFLYHHFLSGFIHTIIYCELCFWWNKFVYMRASVQLHCATSTAQYMRMQLL